MKRSMTICVGLVVAAGIFGCSTGGAKSTGVGYDNREGFVSYGGKQMMLYRFGEVPFKPYVQELRSPAGVQVLRDAPADHLHHHALMFAIGVDGVDFWAETPGCGKQEHRSNGITAFNRVNGSMGQLVEKLDWMGPGGKLLEEERSIETYPLSGATVLTWRSRLTRPEGMAAAKLTGSHYFGLGMRFVETMDKASQFVYADGQPGPVVRGDERLTSGKWCAVQGQVDGKDVTIAMFDGAGNPRPAAWFTMGEPFAYLSATMRLHETPMELKAGQTMKLAYGVAVWDGTVGSEAIGKVYREWKTGQENPKH
jgi:hypothetical protein